MEKPEERKWQSLIIGIVVLLIASGFSTLFAVRQMHEELNEMRAIAALSQPDAPGQAAGFRNRLEQSVISTERSMALHSLMAYAQFGVAIVCGLGVWFMLRRTTLEIQRVRMIARLG
jgi:ABC-type uncharacterized transport system permease subunit